MILTITMNPSIDMSYPLHELKLDTVNRVNNVSKTAGGKGLNVTRVLHQFDRAVTATGLLGGYFGEFIKHNLDLDGISHDFSPIKGETRNSIALLHNNKQTEILEAGPAISLDEQKTFLNKYDSLLATCSVLTISGSLPSGINSDFYVQLIKKANQSHVKVLLDTSGQPLLEATQSGSKPFLIKPNEKEIEPLIGEEWSSHDQVSLKEQLSYKKFSGIEWVVVSLGADGAIVKHKSSFYKVTIPKIDVVSPVGSGDSTIAGFAKAIYDKADEETIIKTGLTAGILNTLEAKTGCINKANFDHYYNLIEINEF